MKLHRLIKKSIKLFVMRLVIAIVFVVALRYVTTNVILTNDIALGQLNGGNEGYIVWELFTKYKNIAEYVCYAIVVAIMYTPTKHLIKNITYINKKENSNENT